MKVGKQGAALLGLPAQPRRRVAQMQGLMQAEPTQNIEPLRQRGVGTKWTGLDDGGIRFGFGHVLGRMPIGCLLNLPERGCDPQKLWQPYPDGDDLPDAMPPLRNILGLINAEA